MRTQIMSYGGGVNTVTMCVLVAQGKLPRPDYILMADTGREGSATWDYLEEVVKPYLARIDLEVLIAPHDLATVDLLSGNGDVLMPMYTAEGRLPTFCSTEWKQRVCHRYARSLGITEADEWIGYTINEIGRVKPSGVKWITRTFPLIDLMLTRRDCINIVLKAGLPEPPRSACKMCPHRTNEEWRFIHENYPQDWQEAIDVEAEVRAKDDELFLHPDRVPLAQADITKQDRRDNRDMQCGLGACMT